MNTSGVVAVPVAEYEVAEHRARDLGGALGVSEVDWKVIVACCGQKPAEFHGDTPDEAVDHALAGLKRARGNAALLRGMIT